MRDLDFLFSPLIGEGEVVSLLPSVPVSLSKSILEASRGNGSSRFEKSVDIVAAAVLLNFNILNQSRSF